MSSNEECTDSSSPPPPPLPPPPPPQSEQHYEESSDEDQDLDPVTKPKKKSRPSAAALTVYAPALDGERQLVMDTSYSASPLAPPPNRIWQEPMQLLLLREMVGYSEINGKCKVSLSYVSKFHSSLEGSPLHKFSVNQILEKMKRFKRMYDNRYGKGKGKGKRNGKTLHPELLELSRKLWGEAGKGKGKKQKRVKVEVVENDDVDVDDDDNDEGDNSFNERRVWEIEMVRIMKDEFYYQEDYTRHKIASLDESTRDFLEKRWLNRKGKLNAAIVNFGRVENVCLKALLP